MKKLLLPIGIPFLILVLAVLLSSCGRDASRYGFGKGERLEAPKGAQAVLSVSLHKSSDGDTIKDIAFLMNNCTVVVQEYIDRSPFGGRLRIMDADGNALTQVGCVPQRLK